MKIILFSNYLLTKKRFCRILRRYGNFRGEREYHLHIAMSEIMSYIFFDLEWNQGYPHSEADKLDEIIQIGAYRLDSWDDEGTAFSAYIRPSIHKKLHHRVKKMLPLDLDELAKAKPFKRVIREFFQWCGRDAQFFTWGSCDARVLDMNLCWYGLEEYLDTEIYDLQRAYDLLIANTDQQAALKDAVEHLGIEYDLEYHDAGNDAFYTAMIGAEMVRRLKSLPTEEELTKGEEAFRQEKRRQAVAAAKEALEELLPDLDPMFTRSCGVYQREDECLKSRAARVCRCPECENLLCTGNWYQVEKYYIARSRCAEHGRYYSCLTMEKTPNELYRAHVAVYEDMAFPRETFHLCKVGGRTIVVAKTPQKRGRFYKRPR